MAPLLALPDPVLADEDVAPGLRVLVPAAMGVVDLGALAATGGPGGLYHRADAGRAGLFASAQELLHAPIVLRQGKERCEKTIYFFFHLVPLFTKTVFGRVVAWASTSAATQKRTTAKRAKDLMLTFRILLPSEDLSLYIYTRFFS